MKFCKVYQEYMQEHQNKNKKKKDLPSVGFKNLKKILKRCRKHKHVAEPSNSIALPNPSLCPHQCSVCDGTFFPSLLKEMSAVVEFFNERAEKLLEVHLATGIKKYYIWCRRKVQKDQHSLIEEGQDLVTYAMINAVAVRKILKKYDKIHFSKQGQAFRSQAQKMHIEILQSPWLCELIAFHINVQDKKVHNLKADSLFEGCALTFSDGNPALTCEPCSSIKLDIGLSCSICLETVFDPVALTCGHIFCYICACSSASVTIVNGLKEASPKEKCPLCREAGVYTGAVHLDELNILLRKRCPEYWEQRLLSERADRVKQAKQHWETQCQVFIGA